MFAPVSLSQSHALRYVDIVAYFSTSIDYNCAVMPDIKALSDFGIPRYLYAIMSLHQ